MVSLPITAKILPYQKNLVYLASAAVVTRMGIAGMRVWENRPSNNNNPDLTENQKRQGLLERFFVEVPGTLLFTVLPLHFGQDVASKLFEKNASSLKIPQFGKGHQALGLASHEIETLNNVLKEVFGRYNPETKQHEATTEGLIYRRLFGQEKPVGQLGKTETVTASLVTLKKRLPDDVYRKVAPQLKEFALKLNRSSCWSILGGVLLSALMGGVITQRANDDIVAPTSKKWLAKHHPETPKPSKHDKKKAKNDAKAAAATKSGGMDPSQAPPPYSPMMAPPPPYVPMMASMSMGSQSPGMPAVGSYLVYTRGPGGSNG
jgi:hypothetical protein